jgi:hypothetical protein
MDEQESYDRLNEVTEKYLDIIEILKKCKPEDRSELARRIAINITDVEKAYAYFMYMINVTHR